MKVFYFITAVLLIIQSSSCQKEISDLDIATQDSIKSNDSSYIYKIYFLNNGSFSSDTIQSYTFHYDNLKRVTQKNDSTFSAADTFEPLENTIYVYDGADTIPKIAITNHADNRKPDTIFYYYDSQKRKLKDSILSPALGNDIAVINYSYNGNRIYSEATIKSTVFNTSNLTRDTADIDAKGNILKDRQYTFDGYNYVLSNISEFTYDSHINPFTKLGIFLANKRLPNNPGGDVYNNGLTNIYLNFISTNNILSQKAGYQNGTYNFNQDNTYSYNSKGLPVLQNFSFNVLNTNPASYKLLYTYKAL